MKKLLTGVVLALLSPLVSAEFFEAWDFHAIDGNVQKNIEIFDSARKIHESMGAHIEYWLHDVNGENVIAYLIRFKDTDGWAKFKDEQMTSEAWSSWVANEWPKAQPYLVTSYAMNNLLNPNAGVDISEGLNVSYMSAWEASDDSNNMELFASIQESVALSEKHGLATQVYINGPSGIFYIFNFGESYKEITSKFQKRNNSPEWQKYWTEAQMKRSGQFVRQAWVTKLQ